jgi:two-component system, NtrC family, response regulator HydG
MARVAVCHPALRSSASRSEPRTRASDGIVLAVVRPVNPLLLGFKTRPRVVVADADRAMRALLVQVLTEEGCEVLEAGDDDQLAELLQIDRGRPNAANVDAVISDIPMPRWGGIDHVAALRAHDPALPVILIAAFPDEDVQAEAARLGASLFSKPFVLRELVSVLNTLLAERIR